MNYYDDDQIAKTLSDLVSTVMTDKTALMDHLLKGLVDAERRTKGLRSVSQSVLDNPSEANLRKQLKVTMDSLASTLEYNRTMQILMLIYLSSGASADAAKVMVKLGHGEEALRMMMAEKFKR